VSDRKTAATCVGKNEYLLISRVPVERYCAVAQPEWGTPTPTQLFTLTRNAKQIEGFDGRKFRYLASALPEEVPLKVSPYDVLYASSNPEQLCL